MFLAAVMLILGMTVLEGRLKRYDFLVYWAVCFVLTGLAGILAALDLIVIRRKSRQAQRELIEEALHEVEEEKRRRGDD